MRRYVYCPNFMQPTIIEVELQMDELDLTAAESKATYDQIKEYVLEKTGLK